MWKLNKSYELAWDQWVGSEEGISNPGCHLQVKCLFWDINLLPISLFHRVGSRHLEVKRMKQGTVLVLQYLMIGKSLTMKWNFVSSSIIWCSQSICIFRQQSPGDKSWCNEVTWREIICGHHKQCKLLPSCFPTQM